MDEQWTNQGRTTRERPPHWPSPQSTGKSLISHLGVYCYLLFGAIFLCRSHQRPGGIQKRPGALLQYRAPFDHESPPQRPQDGFGSPWVHNKHFLILYTQKYHNSVLATCKAKSQQVPRPSRVERPDRVLRTSTRRLNQLQNKFVWISLLNHSVILPRKWTDTIYCFCTPVTSTRIYHIRRISARLYLRQRYWISSLNILKTNSAFSNTLSAHLLACIDLNWNYLKVYSISRNKFSLITSQCFHT